MITGSNPSSEYDEYQEYAEYGYGGSGHSGPESILDVISNLEKRKENLLKGGVNCIPLPFKRFRSEIPGIEQGQYVLVTANQKTGKTQYADFVYVFSVLDYCFEHKDQCSCHIIYFSLEESIQKVIERYMSYLLYKLDGLRYSPADLRSTSADYPVPDEVLDLLKSERYQERLRFFEECVQFDTENTNPTGILRVCEEYAKSVGDYRSHKMMSKNGSGKSVDVFDSYTQDDPNHYKIVIVDHIGLVDKEQGFKTKDSVDKVSEYFVKYLRNRYNYTCVAIQQQASDAEGLEAIKARKMVPTAATLGDSKYTARDCDIAIGLFDPSKFGLANWLGYKIQDVDGIGLKSNARFLYVLANRNGEMGGVCPLFFDGAVCNFEELPRPDDTKALSAYNEKARQLKINRRLRKFSLLTFMRWKRKKFC